LLARLASLWSYWSIGFFSLGFLVRRVIGSRLRWCGRLLCF
jgi:hypothetical protein